MSRKVILSSVPTYKLKLQCVECGGKDSFVIGIQSGNMPTIEEAKKNIATDEWNGWWLKDKEICPKCRFTTGKTVILTSQIYFWKDSNPNI